MCGICGAFRLFPTAAPIDRDALRAIRARMAKRGPDGDGEWWSDDGSAALGHRRLAILDLSDAGAQPMADPTGRYRIVYNGEIYNFRELRAALEREGVAFRTASDTELILALWARDGERSLARLRGMYAFAIHDREEKTLTLVRDPFGIKPLYYEVRDEAELRFASQVKALEAGGASLEVDPGGLAGFLLWGSVPEPWTIRKAIRALPAGHLLVVKGGEVGAPRPIPAFDAGEGEPASLAEALASTVRAHLVSDVPVALFLSAGLDSALLAALATAERARQGNNEPIATFTVRFAGWEGSDRDEGPLAAQVAAALGTRHLERLLTRDEVAAAWPQALAAMDQPSIDGFNTFVVARAAHEAGIKVALSGLGGDELFGSYPSFRDVPHWSRRARQLAAVPASHALWPAVARTFARDRPKLQGLLRDGGTIPGAYHLRRGLFLAPELASIVGRRTAAEGLTAYRPIRSTAAALDGPAPWDTNHQGDGRPESRGDWEAVQRLEAALYLRNQLLRDADWAAMASSVELRVPFVDAALWQQLAHRSFEPARSRGKSAALRQVAEKLAAGLPAELWDRPKSGFTVPVAEWMLPAREGDRDTAGKGSRRIARRLLEEWGIA
ncbi:MAG: asparagine synthase (glutamine-hydrolyzing) [Thermoanaerobaculia bacterium]